MCTAGRQCVEGTPTLNPLLIDLGVEHYLECLAVEHEAFGSIAAEYGITAANTPDNPAFWTLADLAAVIAKGFSLYGAQAASGRILGCAFLGPTRSDATRWQLRHLAVLPAVGGRGYGEALVAEAARRAYGAGATALTIGMVAENRRLSAWYHRLGFIATEVGCRYPGLPFHVDHLELALPTDHASTGSPG